MNPIVNIAIEAARLAGRMIVKGAERPDLLKISHKGPRNIVTDVDMRAEEAIIAHIKKSYPQHATLGEETGLHGDHEILWIIDPLDGTSNFAHNYPHYCVSIAIQIAGRVEHGVIYDPVRDELFVASLGRGAQLNDRRIRMPQRVLEDALVSATYPVRNSQEALDYGKKMAICSTYAAGMRRSGSAALDLAYVAAGRLDVMFAKNLKQWDFAAGILLVHEAGGLISNWQGAEVSSEEGEILATSPKLLKSFVKMFNQN